MSTTFAAWLNSLEGLTIAGVTRCYTAGPPASLTTADLPAQWLELPHGETRPACAGAEGGDRTLYTDLVIALEPVGQNTQAANFDATVAMLDSIETGLKALTSVLLGPMTWRSRLAIVTVSGNTYWAVITEVEGLG